MKGFFSKAEVESMTVKPSNRTLSCISCGLYTECKNPKIEPFGNFKKKILNIGEAPGETEDQRGKPWQGKVGKLLEQTYKRLGVNLFEDCLNINAVNCRPMDKDGNNKAPTNHQMDCCRASILQVIEKYKPKVIILLGNSAVYSLLGHRWKKDLGGITKWRGWTIPDQDFKCWLCPTFHPSYIERSEGGAEETIWIQDLKQALEKAKDPFPVYRVPNIEILTDLAPLREIRQEFAFDYETTGLKPHAVGHRIVCASVADSADHAYVFMMPETKLERKPFTDLLINPKIGKIAQNMKFEHAWSLVRLRVEVLNWIWDTMLASHVYDNRPGITGLKYQTYVQFGIMDYSSEVAPYLQAVDNTNGNGLNRILELVEKPGGKHKLLTYCGMDSIFEYRLAMKQRENILPF